MTLDDGRRPGDLTFSQLFQATQSTQQASISSELYTVGTVSPSRFPLSQSRTGHAGVQIGSRPYHFAPDPQQSLPEDYFLGPGSDSENDDENGRYGHGDGAIVLNDDRPMTMTATSFESEDHPPPYSPPRQPGHVSAAPSASGSMERSSTASSETHHGRLSVTAIEDLLCGNISRNARRSLTGRSQGYLRCFTFIGIDDRYAQSRGRRERWKCRLCHQVLLAPANKISNLGTHLHGTNRRAGCLSERGSCPAEALPELERDENGCIAHTTYNGMRKRRQAS